MNIGPIIMHTFVKYINFWEDANSFSPSSPYSEYESEKTVNECFYNLFLPLKKISITYFETIEQKVSDEQALQRAKNQAYQLATNRLNGRTPAMEKFDFHESNGQKFVDCFIEAVIKLC